MVGLMMKVLITDLGRFPKLAVFLHCQYVTVLPHLDAPRPQSLQSQALSRLQSQAFSYLQSQALSRPQSQDMS